MDEGPRDESGLKPPAKYAGKIKEPFKLLFQIWFLFVTSYFRFIQSIFLHIFKRPKSLTGEVAVVTGAGRGLGMEIALELTNWGATVVIIDLDEQSANETAAFINSFHPGKAKAYKVDIGNSNEVKNVAEKIKLDFDHVDILINNAAIFAGGPFVKLTDEQYESIVNVNFTGYVRMIKQFLPGMTERNHGHIASISGIMGLTTLDNSAVYTGTKWAITGLMEALRDELKHINGNKVQTSTICPYFINTSADYVNALNLRIPAISASYAAKVAVNSIRYNEVISTIPSYQYYALIIRKILPINIVDAIKRIFYAEVANPDYLFGKNNPINKQMKPLRP